MGEAINLVNNFQVEKVIFNCGEYNDLEKELIKVLDEKRINYYSFIKELNIFIFLFMSIYLCWHMVNIILLCYNEYEIN